MAKFLVMYRDAATASLKRGELSGQSESLLRHDLEARGWQVILIQPADKPPLAQRIRQMTKAKRAGKVFLDWSQNSAAKTTICPWSLRGRERPQVALPRSWEEVEAADAGDVELVQRTLDEV